MTISVGIDLGTTNSAIVVDIDGKPTIVKNTYGIETTPSVVAVTPNDKIVVGKPAFERLQRDPKNVKQEIKRIMGSDDKIKISNKEFSAEELSAEILKTLREDALRKYPDLNANAVVITIPAHFSTLQAEATKRAGEMAGFKYVELLQEPIAAAFTYGFEFNKDKKNTWLVYDLGGGTFDAALIGNDNGELRVIGHAGDNFLGGKDIDRVIVDRIIMPELMKRDKDIDFYKYENTIKVAAQNAKINLSSTNETTIDIDIREEDIFESIDININQLKEISRDIIAKSVRLCKETMANSHVEKIDKVIFVGGQTQALFIRELVGEALGVPIDTNVDPLTAVAMGACIYGKSKIIEDAKKIESAMQSGAKKVELKYNSLTSDTSEMIVGAIDGIGIEAQLKIQRSDNGFETTTSINKNGKFKVNVDVLTGKLNTYYLYLIDANGKGIEIIPNEFSISYGVGVAGAPIPRSIGVGIAKIDFLANKVENFYDVIFEKDSLLPLEKEKIYRTSRELKVGDRENALPITIYEGEAKDPKHNLFICEIEVRGNEINKDLPAGSEVKLRLKVDNSRSLKVEAFIPDLNLTLNARSTTYDKKLDKDELKSELKETERLIKKISDNIDSNKKREFKKNQDEIKSLLNSEDEDDGRKANSRLKELQNLLADIEEKASGADKYEETKKELEIIKELVDGVDDDGIRDDLESRMIEVEQSIQKQDKKPRALLDEIEDIKNIAIKNNFGFWGVCFEHFANQLINNNAAKNLIEQGNKAISNNDFDGLRQAVSGLASMLNFDSNDTGDDDIIRKIAGITL